MRAILAKGEERGQQRENREYQGGLPAKRGCGIMVGQCGITPLQTKENPMSDRATFAIRMTPELAEFLSTESDKRGWSRNQLIVNRLEAWKRSLERSKDHTKPKRKRRT